MIQVHYKAITHGDLIRSQNHWNTPYISHSPFRKTNHPVSFKPKEMKERVVQVVDEWKGEWIMRQPRDLRSRKPLPHLGLECQWENPRSSGWNLNHGEVFLVGAGLSREGLPELWRRHGCFQTPHQKETKRARNTLVFSLQLHSNSLLIPSIGWICQEARRQESPSNKAWQEKG